MLMFLKADWSDNDNDLRWLKQQKFGCNGQHARFVWTFSKEATS